MNLTVRVSVPNSETLFTPGDIYVYLCVFSAVSSYFKSKLRGLYKTAGTDAETEVE